MEPLSNRSDRDSNLPEYYVPSYNADDLPKETPQTATGSHAPANSPLTDGKHQPRLPFGFSPLVFGLVVALITAIIVGGAVGGGVGGALSGGSSCSAAVVTVSGTSTLSDPLSTTSSPTSPTSSASSSLATDYSALPYNSISSMRLDCPALNSQNYASVWDGQIFNLHCDFLYNSADITAIFAYSWSDCVEACAAANHYAVKAGGSNTTCLHVLFQAGFDSAVYSGRRNCWIKGSDVVVGTAPPANRLLAADLVT